jgi:hypothetical protein
MFGAVFLDLAGKYGHAFDALVGGAQLGLFAAFLLVVQATHGRLHVSVTIASKESPTGTEAPVMTEVRDEVFASQLAKLPLLEDFPASSNSAAAVVGHDLAVFMGRSSAILFILVSRSGRHRLGSS